MNKPINFLAPQNVKKKFYKACKDKNINPSSIFREFMKAFSDGRVVTEDNNLFTIEKKEP